MKALPYLAAAACLLAPMQVSMAADPITAAPAAQLPGATVEGKPTVIDRSDRHLHQLQNSLPELGSSHPHHRKMGERLRDYLSRHRDPNQAAGQQRAMMERAQTPP